MFMAFGLLVALAAPASVVAQHHPGARITAAIVHGNYALVTGRRAGTPTTYGLRLTREGWHIACTFASEPLPTQLRSQCGFPQAVAIELSADEATQKAMERGELSLATISQTRAYNWSVKGPDRDDERERLQLLHQLSEQMRTGMITREQAIRKWNRFRLTWALP